MSDTVIRVENLSKHYRLGTIGSNTLRDDVNRLVARLRGQPDPTLKIGQTDNRNSQLATRNSESIWALKDVSFEVKQGEVVGIIGRNGAGKSTLLKILSRITAPSSGQVQVKGRIASLLEVGTGFHPELTGRENIYLNGAILGMKRAEIARKFDEIVDFAGVEQFIDTPVKRYSSGMYVRLAFAVAAHLEPEILLVDEVLAVGDAEFQKKCLGKMGEVAKEGRTVLFVSHNMGAVRKLCYRSFLFDKGLLFLDGATKTVVDQYIIGENGEHLNDPKIWLRTGSGIIQISEIQLLNNKQESYRILNAGSKLEFFIRGTSRVRNENFTLALQFITSDDIPAIWLYDQFTEFTTGGDGSFLVKVSVDDIMLMPGLYYINVWIGKNGFEEYDYVRKALDLQIVQSERIASTQTVTQSLGLVYGILDAVQLE